MNIDVLLTVEDVRPEHIKGKTVIVLDILRATCTIVTALAMGAKEIIPVNTPEDAIRVADKFKYGEYLLGGERSGAKIQNFLLGNSPEEYTKEIVEGKTVIFTSTNGTRAISKARPAKRIIIGSFLNCRAVSEYVMIKGDDLVIICAGTKGNIALEDLLAAGNILDNISKLGASCMFGNLSPVALKLYHYCKNSLDYHLYNCKSVKRLVSQGLEEDVRYCLQRDVFSIVPGLKEESLVILSEIQSKTSQMQL